YKILAKKSSAFLNLRPVPAGGNILLFAVVYGTPNAIIWGNAEKGAYVQKNRNCERQTLFATFGWFCPSGESRTVEGNL
ncbi:MAG TPA: hypothetical protein PK114_01660, partial [Smithellaceae bacterium]|nr:hypothetical protein [Smithellaceae bacterium]